MRNGIYLFLFITGLCFPAYSADVMMSCQLEGETGKLVHFKYEDKFLSTDKAYSRLEGKWVNICDGIEKNIGQVVEGKIRTFSFIDDKSATCNYEFPKETYGELKWIIDFETLTWASYKNGQPNRYYNIPSNGNCK